MNKIALFAGSFDPITLGHTEIINRALPIFDKIVIGIGINTQKKYLFDTAKRQKLIQQIFENEPKVSVEVYSGLTIEYCKAIKAQFMLRGLRTSADFEYEKTIAQINHTLSGLETIFLIAQPQFSHISSTLVREIIINGGNPAPFLPPTVAHEVLNIL